MQCPKCGYISFDHLEVCVKCKKNIKAVSDSLHGSVFPVKAPAFLLLQPRQTEDEKDTADDFGKQSGADEEYVDDDLEILIEDAPEQDAEIEFTEDRRKGELELATGKKAAEDEEEDREIEIDFSQFEDAREDEAAPADEGETGGGKEEQPFAMEMPAALTDISDLAPPGRMTGVEKEGSQVSAEKSDGDLDMDELDFDLGLDDLDDHPPSAPASAPASAPPSAKETMLSLDDIDFSETLTKSTPKAPSKSGTTDMDEELNFDLDLGGLSIHKDK